MLILKKPVVAEHRNPALNMGHTYQLIQDASESSHYKKGRVFTYANGRLTWLAMPNCSGGYDLPSVITDRDLKFIEVDLTIV